MGRQCVPDDFQPDRAGAVVRHVGNGHGVELATEPCCVFSEWINDVQPTISANGYAAVSRDRQNRVSGIGIAERVADVPLRQKRTAVLDA
jgi:hypothetical protein